MMNNDMLKRTRNRRGVSLPLAAVREASHQKESSSERSGVICHVRATVRSRTAERW